MSQRTHRHSIQCILTPGIVSSICNNGTAMQRASALRTLGTDHTFRSLRAAPRVQVAQALALEGQKQRTIYDAQNGQTLPGAVVRSEAGAATGDLAVDEAYDGLGATYDFFWDSYERNSVDDEGRALDATVHFGQDYNNAFWNGQQMVFGDGDGDLFNRFTIAVDIIGHELAHGVTQDEAGLNYFSQSGALNESMSDVFGSLVKQHSLGQSAEQADWLIGAGLFTDNINGVALRSMKAPGTAYDDPVIGKDPQPAHMDAYVKTMEDNGGVHINSGIPNHAFYLVASQLGGSAWERAGLIWYETLRDPGLRANTGFRRFARLTSNVAEKLYGYGSAEHQAVRTAWREVGLRVK